MLSNPFKYSKEPQFCRFFRSLNKKEEYDSFDSTSVHIFREEIHLGVMPIGGRSAKHSNFSIKITGDKNNSERAKKLLESLASHNRQRTVELVCDVVNTVVKGLLHRGVSYYEITQSSPESLELNSFTSDRLFNVLGMYIQLVPVKDREMWKKKFAVKTSNSIWKIEIPKALGGPSGYRKLIFELGKYSDLYPKCFNIESTLTQPNNFNFNEYVTKTKAYQYKILELWGGNLRHTSTEYANEYYLIHRIVRFNRAQAILREHVIKSLNSLLQKKGIKSKICVEGLPPAEFINSQLKKLSEGEVELTKVIEDTRAS